MFSSRLCVLWAFGEYFLVVRFLQVLDFTRIAALSYRHWWHGSKGDRHLRKNDVFGPAVTASDDTRGRNPIEEVVHGILQLFFRWRGWRRAGHGRFVWPRQIDQMIRQAIQFCWMALPKERRNAEEVESQVRRLVDRAMEDFREDREAFGRADDA